MWLCYMFYKNQNSIQTSVMLQVDCTSFQMRTRQRVAWPCMFQLFFEHSISLTLLYTQFEFPTSTTCELGSSTVAVVLFCLVLPGSSGSISLHLSFLAFSVCFVSRLFFRCVFHSCNFHSLISSSCILTIMCLVGR